MRVSEGSQATAHACRHLCQWTETQPRNPALAVAANVVCKCKKLNILTFIQYKKIEIITKNRLIGLMLRGNVGADLRGIYFVFYSPCIKTNKTPPHKTAHLQTSQVDPQTKVCKRAVFSQRIFRYYEHLFIFLNI